MALTKQHRKNERDKEDHEVPHVQSHGDLVPGYSRHPPKIPLQTTGPAAITEHIMPSPYPALRGVRNKNFPELLDLPQELRLEIWKYTVTDPFTDDLVVHIFPDLVSNSFNDPLNPIPCSTVRHSNRFHRIFKTSLSKPRKQLIDIAILR